MGGGGGKKPAPVLFAAQYQTQGIRLTEALTDGGIRLQAAAAVRKGLAFTEGMSMTEYDKLVI